MITSESEWKKIFSEVLAVLKRFVFESLILKVFSVPKRIYQLM